MVDPIKLVVKPTTLDEVKESVVKLLEQTLKEANEGSITTIVMLIEYIDEDWADRISSTVNFSKAIGRLEITKQEWIDKYLRNRNNG